MKKQDKKPEVLNETVRIVAVNEKYKIAPYYLTPKFDDATKQFLTGQQHLTKEELDKQPLVINPDESYPVKHLMMLRPGVPADAIMLNFFKEKNDIIAPSKKDIIPGQHHFYIENKEEEAIMSVSSIDLEYEAQTLLRGMTLEEMNDFARLLGEPVKSMSKNQVESALKKRARSTPGLIIDALKDRNKEFKITLTKLVDAGILSKRDGGKYYNGQELVGVNELYAIEFLRDSRNADLVSQWLQLIKETVS